MNLFTKSTADHINHWQQFFMYICHFIADPYLPLYLMVHLYNKYMYINIKIRYNFVS
jgi:hypothetical protein